MKNALNESKRLFYELFNEYLRREIINFLNDVYINDDYDCKKIWIMDKKIGGIGGYCMPSNPVKNPFPAGEERKLFRPLQYARADIEICDIRIHPRYIVEMCGMHLEGVLKLFLERKQTMGIILNLNATLGKAVHKADKLDLLDKKTVDMLILFITIFNKSKHEVNMNDNRERLFTASDAIVAYFAARIIGQKILEEELKYDLSCSSYEIVP